MTVIQNWFVGLGLIVILTKDGKLNMKFIVHLNSQEYMPNTRTSFGVGGLPRGNEYYAACLKWQLSVNLTADEIHNIGIREVNRVHKELEKV